MLKVHVCAYMPEHMFEHIYRIKQGFRARHQIKMCNHCEQDDAIFMAKLQECNPAVWLIASLKLVYIGLLNY